MQSACGLRSSPQLYETLDKPFSARSCIFMWVALKTQQLPCMLSPMMSKNSDSLFDALRCGALRQLLPRHHAPRLVPQ